MCIQLLICCAQCVYDISGASPYETLLVADAGDVYFTMYNMTQAADDIHQQYTKFLSTGCKLLTVGGDHTITYPILKAYRVSGVLCKLLLFLKSLWCWSIAPHAVVLTLMREHYYCVYCVCQLMYWCMLLIYTKQLPVSGLWVHNVLALM